MFNSNKKYIFVTSLIKALVACEEEEEEEVTPPPPPSQ